MGTARVCTEVCVSRLSCQVKELEGKVKELEPKVCAAPPDHEELVKCRALVRSPSVWWCICSPGRFRACSFLQ